MPQKKKKAAPKKSAGSRAGQQKMNIKNAKIQGNPASVANQIIPCVLGVFALFVTVCYFFPGSVGFVGRGVKDFLFGILGGGAFTLPLLIAALAIMWRHNVENGALGTRIALSVIVTLLVSVLLHAFAPEVTRTYQAQILWDFGLSLTGGGVLGGLLGTLMLSGFDFVGTLIIVIAALLIFGIFLFGATPRMIRVTIAYKLKHRREAAAASPTQNWKTGREVIPDDPYLPMRAATPGFFTRLVQKNHYFDPDVPLEEVPEYIPVSPINDDVRIDTLSEDIVDADSYSAAKRRRDKEITVEGDDAEPLFTIDDAAHLEQIKAVGRPLPDPELDWKSIFIDPKPEECFDDLSDHADAGESATAEAELTVERRAISERPARKASPPPPETLYKFPPLALLHPDEIITQSFENDLKINAKRLVDTLKSFNVNTKIVNISHGPTITRYELQPEAGTRVRSIANLVDDIALNLATTGVRIEAPIPGKSAVGIEVPNHSAATVYLRGLLEDRLFTSAPSRITAALGKDVAGAPIYFDIAKMPHLLIAGATGMGKSVSLNSIIVSLLYKARPDEVKLILIDPKKVELNIYNGIPHLLVPVVSDPKKAAGSLSWAVTEMERRFELIEAVGARDIKAYNTLTVKDNEKEFLPQVVIIIDELADLMMTAPDDVEQSICRLAQKARAAGMHLIIGTQRPSVDVITGLIKANIPSRIAFTVASQVDSRTIIDITGAEKLIGRGDMLYAPVGASKPLRVQGAFVSEDEIEKITEFLKAHTKRHEYSNEVMASIERAAELCGNKKGAASMSSDSDGEGDPMLRAAIELAVDSGKISTSLIQRRLSLGYGRAAKLIDRMEVLGYVSAPEGQKPREVLITKQQYMEMVLKDADVQ